MKIHTTQDLSVLARQQQHSTANSVSLSELRFTQGNKTQNEKPGGDVDSPDAKKKNYKAANTAVVIGGLIGAGALVIRLLKPPAPKNINMSDLKTTVKKFKDKVTVGDIREQAKPEVKRGDKILNSKAFATLLKWSANEPVMQAAMSALICLILRPATIMALPNKNGKENNMYASAHSMASGVMGLISTAFIAQPFQMGAARTMDVMLKDLKEDALKRLWPMLDIKSIYAKNGTRKPIEEWLFKDGRKFIKSFKDVEKMPMFKHLNEISAESYRALGADVDWAAQKGKSFNEVIDKKNRALYDVIDWKRLGIIVDREYMGAEKLSSVMQKESTSSARVLLQDLDREFLEKIIKDAEKDSIWKKLDINSVYENGEVVDLRKWKEIGTGKQWKLDLDNAYISSPYDTADYIPRISGKFRIEPNGEVKYAAYLKNGKDGKLGTIIDETMAETEKRNEVHTKILTWLPDILTRPLVATATIALIPVALKKVFHLEKGKKPETNETQALTVNNNVNQNKEIETNNNTAFKGNSDDSSDNTKSSEPSFKGKNGSGNGKKSVSKVRSFFNELVEKLIAKPLAKIYGKPMYESKFVGKLADKCSKARGGMTNHMATLGALLTSSVYVNRTLHKKDLDDDRKRTLAVNQALCFVIPTICAYTVDKLLKNWTKTKVEYRYGGLRQSDIEIATLKHKSKEEIAAMEGALGKNLKGVRTLISLAIFTLIYRYIAPVLITPVANKIGDNIIDKRRAKAAALAEAQTVVMNNQKSEPQAQTIVMNNQYNEPMAKRA